jgi:hypothetical protein
MNWAFELSGILLVVLAAARELWNERQAQRR